MTQVDFEHSGSLVPLLSQLNVSLALSTYQAGKVITVGVAGGRADIRFQHFDQVMGLCRTGTGLAVGTRRQIWTLAGAPDLAKRLPPAGTYDVAFLARHSHYTGPIMGHDLAWSGGELWITNTLFSCLCVLGPEFNFVPRWRPPFVSALAAEDRCHLNGLAADDTGPRYATALGETDTPAGWRPGKVAGGCLIDVRANAVIARGLSMPHSPRLYDSGLWVLDSGHGRLSRYAGDGRLDPVAHLPGYTRGLDFHAGYAFVGLSRIRESNVFGGLPIAERRDDLRCGMGVVDLGRGEVVATLFFKSGVEEVFDVKTLPGYLTPFIAGPHPDTDQVESVWVVPNP